MIKIPLGPQKLLKYLLYVQIRFLRLCERMDDASNSTFKWKKFKNNKKENFNTLMSREMESIIQKVKKAWEEYVENPLE